MTLRKLDARAKLPATVFTYTFGILDLVVIARVIPKRPAYLPIFVKPLLASLVMGVGMCLSMKVIGGGTTGMFILGIFPGLVGLVCMGVRTQKRIEGPRIPR